MCVIGVGMQQTDADSADTLRAEKAYLDALDYYRAAIAKQPTNAKLYNKVGITTDIISRGKNSGVLSSTTGFSDNERDAMQRMPSYGKVGLAAVVGNEDGAHHVAAEVCQALAEVGFTIPTGGVTYWVGEAMGDKNYADLKTTPKAVAEWTPVRRQDLSRRVCGEPLQPFEVFVKGIWCALRMEANVRRELRQHVIPREQQLLLALPKTDMPGGMARSPFDAEHPTAHVKHLGAVELHCGLGGRHHLAEGSL